MRREHRGRAPRFAVQEFSPVWANQEAREIRRFLYNFLDLRIVPEYGSVFEIQRRIADATGIVTTITGTGPYLATVVDHDEVTILRRTCEVLGVTVETVCSL
jgi:4-diphosphocytidyl-2C-methyl-D-erythritol kinase